MARKHKSTPEAPGTVAAIAYDGLCTFEFGIAVEVFGLPRPEFDFPWYGFCCRVSRGPSLYGRSAASWLRLGRIRRSRNGQNHYCPRVARRGRAATGAAIGCNIQGFRARREMSFYLLRRLCACRGGAPPWKTRNDPLAAYSRPEVPLSNRQR